MLEGCQDKTAAVETVAVLSLEEKTLLILSRLSGWCQGDPEDVDQATRLSTPGCQTTETGSSIRWSDGRDVKLQQLDTHFKYINHICILFLLFDSCLLKYVYRYGYCFDGLLRTTFPSYIVVEEFTFS